MRTLLFPDGPDVVRRTVPKADGWVRGGREFSAHFVNTRPISKHKIAKQYNEQEYLHKCRLF